MTKNNSIAPFVKRKPHNEQAARKKGQRHPDNRPESVFANFPLPGGRGSGRAGTLNNRCVSRELRLGRSLALPNNLYSQTPSEINRARVVFNYATKNGLIDKPQRFGDGFERPSKKAMLLNKAARGPKTFQADELRKLIGAATQPMKAMLLLGVNGGLGNNDIALLPMTALDLKANWMVYPRPKTGIMRRIPLWPETVKALQGWIAKRPVPKDEADAELVFLTARGVSWGRSINDRPITHECRKLIDKLGIIGGRGFYGCRHTFEKVGGEWLCT